MAASVHCRQSVRRQLAELAQWLEAGDCEQLEVFGSSDQDEWLLRLAGMVLALTTQHQVDKSDRCRFCCTPPTGWRRWWPRWRRPTACRVQHTTQLFSRATLDVVWWRVFQLVGDQRSIQEVRAWLAAEAITATLPRVEAEDVEATCTDHALLTDARVLLLDGMGVATPGRHTVEEADASSVSVPELIARAVERGKVVRLAWPVDDPDAGDLVTWGGRDDQPTGVIDY